MNVNNAPSDPIVNDAEPRSGTGTNIGPGSEGAALDSFLYALFLAQCNAGTLIIPGVFYSVLRLPDPKCAKELRTGPGVALGTCRGAVAAADVKGGLGTGGNHVMGATAGAVARAVARVEGLEGDNAKS